MQQLATSLLISWTVSLLGVASGVCLFVVCLVCRAIHKKTIEGFWKKISREAVTWYSLYFLPGAAIGCCVDVAIFQDFSLQQRTIGLAATLAGLLIAEGFSWYMGSNKYRATGLVKTLYYLSPMIIPIITFLVLITVGGVR